MKPRDTYFYHLKKAKYKYYRSVIYQLANGIPVPLRFAIGSHVCSNKRALSCKVAGSKSLPFLYCLFETFSRKFLVNGKVKNPFDEIGGRRAVAERKKPTPVRRRAVVGAPGVLFLISLVVVGY